MWMHLHKWVLVAVYCCVAVLKLCRLFLHQTSCCSLCSQMFYIRVSRKTLMCSVAVLMPWTETFIILMPADGVWVQQRELCGGRNQPRCLSDELATVVVLADCLSLWSRMHNKDRLLRLWPMLAGHVVTRD